MAALIDAPVNSLPSVGLRAMVGAGVQYSGLEPLSGSNPIRWLQGWQFETAPCANVLQQGGICVAERSFSPGKPTYYSGEAITVEAQITCSTFADPQQLKDFVVAEFERRIFGKISAEIWSGTQARANIAAGRTAYSANRWLARSDHATTAVTKINGGTVLALPEALAQLDSTLLVATDAGNNLIHVPYKAMTYLGRDQDLISPVGARRYTWNGTGVVAEAGYAGTGPDTAANGPSAVPAVDQIWLYGTGPITIHAAADLSGIESVDIAQNNYSVTVSGAYVYGWGCAHYAVLADLVP